jgi:uncharacterized protein YhjY with autotransporter beta-barrel domain
MSGGKPSRFAPRRPAWRSDSADSLLLQQVPQKRASNVQFFVISSAIMFGLSLCIATAVKAQMGPSLTTIPGLTPPEQATADAIVTLCPPLANAQGRGELAGAQDDLTSRCRNLVNNGRSQGNLPQTRDALRDISPDKIPTQGTTQVEAARVQIANIGTRLAALRAGATGISLQGLAFNLNGKSLPGTMLASLLPDGASRDVGRADEASIFSKFGTSIPGNTSQGTLGRLLAQRQSSGTAAVGQASAFDRLGIFVNGTLTLGDKDGTSRETGFDFDTLGVTAGVDYRFTDRFVLGGAFGFAATDADINSAGGSLDADQYSGSIFATYYFEKLSIDGIASFGWTSLDTIRNINYSFPCVNAQGQPAPCIGSGGSSAGMVETVNQAAKGDTDGTHFSLGAGAGYDFRHGGFTFGPFGRANYFRFDVDGYKERIDNPNPGVGLPLEFDGQDLESLQTALGVQASYAISTTVGVFMPQVLFEWIHEFLDNRRTIAARYVFDPNRVPLSIATDNPDRNFFNLGFGLSGVFRRGMSTFIYYQTALGLEEITKHDIIVGVRLAF